MGGGGGELISERLRYSLQIPNSKSPDTRKIRVDIHFRFLHLRIYGLDSSRLLASLVYMLSLLGIHESLTVPLAVSVMSLCTLS